MLTFRVGVSRGVGAYCVVWPWFDRCGAYEFVPNAEALLESPQDCAAEEGCEIDDALARVTDHVVAKTEALGGDITNDNLAPLVSERGLNAFNGRRRNQDDG
ncbi:MAG: hypothetical protein AAGE90_12670 [Pseudomonadota bacterium]